MLMEIAGLKPTSAGARSNYPGAKPHITVQRPFAYGESIEIRRLFSDEDLEEFTN